MRLHRFLYLLIFLFLLSGCGKTSFIGRRYDNFTAYYNTFYNAKKEYSRGVDAIERASEQNIDRNRYLQVFITPDRVSNQQNFDNAIKKSADVLRENPTSKWVDDALMLIGKSYFYLQNYVGAEQKFQEIIDLGGELEDEARFWLARTLVASNAFGRAADHLEVSLNREGLSSRWEPMLRMSLGELYVGQESWGEAAAELEQALERVKDKDLAGRAQFLLAQIYETLEQYDNAKQSYKRVLRYKPEYSLAYAAEFSEVRLEGLHGDANKALRLLRSMDRDDKNFDNRAELMYLRGRIHQASGNADQAFDTYDALLFSDDRTLNASAVRGAVHYALGELYRDLYVDFVYAAAHFDTARSSLGSLTRNTANSGVQAQFAPEAITDSERQAEVFGNYAEVFDQIVQLDSLIWLGTMEDEEFDVFILDLRKKRAEELAEQQREVARRQAEQQFQNISNAGVPGQRKQIDGPEALGNSDQGFLFYKDQIRVQEGLISFITIWGERPRVPNWRRLEAVENAGSEQDEGGGELAEADPAAAEQLANDLLPVIDYSNVPRDEERMAEVQEERALVRYELANVLFLSMSRPDSAAAWYRMVIDETSQLPVAQRAYYALAEVQRALGDDASARRIYEDVLVKYPDSDFANQVRERIGLAPVAEEVTDSLALAEEAYEKAYRLWQEKQYQQAVTDMVLLASNYSVPDLAPKALLATGTIYLEWAEQDRLNVHALPLPVVSDSLLFDQGLVDSTFFMNELPDSLLSALAAPDTFLLALPDSIDAHHPELLRALRLKMEADSIREASSTLIQHADSMYVLSDSLYGASDSLQVKSDSLYSVSEALQLEFESLNVWADSIDGAADSLLSQLGIVLTNAAGEDQAVADSMAYVVLKAPQQMTPAATKYLKLGQLFTAIKERYPSTPHATYADQMLRALVDLKPSSDSTLELVVAEAEMQEMLEAMSDEERHLRGPEPLDTNGEGWTLIVGSYANAENAQSQVDEYLEKGYKSAVIQGATRVRVAVGQFPGLDEAKAALEMFKDEFPPTTWFLDIQKPR